ncbi:MAG: IPT/TIG domain-containing protein [Bacteroidales bacterium]|nr:IPT/TIG domain-containing protein [Bacteroidales bacterium]
MKKFIKFSFLAAVMAAVLGTVSCTQKEADTDQLSGPVALAAMSPNPIVRGAELHLFGINMDKVVEVLIPGIDPIKEITAGEGKGRLSEIIVTVPVEGPEVGKVTVKDAGGNTSTSKFNLTYTEGIEFEGFESAASVLSGDVITLKGEYMSSVQEVIFTSGTGSAYATGKQIFEKTRHSIKVYVPASATTGIIKVSDVNEFVDPTAIANIFPSTKELVVGKPTVDKMEFEDAIKAGTVLSFTGAHLDMIAKVEFSGVEPKEFKLNDDSTALTAALPAKAADGDVVFTSYAGDTFVAATLAGVLPSGMEFSADEESDDPRFKAGYKTLIKGEDLDLVTGVSFGGVYADFVYDAGDDIDPVVYAYIPATAPDGDVKVHLANGSEVVVKEALELVNPTVDEVSADSINAREEFTITGKDLDLVTAVSVGGIACEFTPEVIGEEDGEDENGDPVKVPVYSSTKIIVTSSPIAVSGDVLIEKANGWSSVISQMEVAYDELVFLEVPASVALGKAITVTGTNLFAIDKVYIKGKQVVNWISRSDTQMVFELPEGIGPGVYYLVLDLNDGSTISWAKTFEVTAPYTETFIWEGEHDLAGWGANLEIQPNGFQTVNLKEGDIVRIYYKTYEDWWMVKVQDGSWGAVDLKIPDNPQDANAFSASTHPYSPDGSQFMSIEVTAELAQQLLAPAKALALNGQGAKIMGVSVIQFGSAKTYLWQGEIGPTNWDGDIIPSDVTGLDKLSPGMTMGFDFYCDPTQEYWQVEFMGTWWTQFPSLMNPDGSRHIWEFKAEDTNLEFELAQADIDIIQAQGFLFCGNGVFITGIYVL